MCVQACYRSTLVKLQKHIEAGEEGRWRTPDEHIYGGSLVAPPTAHLCAICRSFDVVSSRVLCWGSACEPRGPQASLRASISWSCCASRRGGQGLG